MAPDPHTASRPCPSCGACLRIGATRLHQKLQCPKCLSTIVMEPEAAAAARNGKAGKPSPKTARARKMAGRAGKPPTHTRAAMGDDDPKHAARQDPVKAIRAENTRLATRYAELLAEHAALVDRYGDIVASFDELIGEHTILVQRIGALNQASHHLRSIG